MTRLLILRRARRLVDRTVRLYDIARGWAALGDLCRAGYVKEVADGLAAFALDDLRAAERYLPVDLGSFQNPS